MGRKRKGARVLGPYAETRSGGVRFRIVVVDRRGRKEVFFRTGEREAQKLAAAARKRFELKGETGPTLIEIVNEFTEHKASTGAWGRRTVERSGADLAYFAKEKTTASMAQVDVRMVRRFLSRMAEAGYALAYQRSRYAVVAEFLEWCRRLGLLAHNPCDDIDRSELRWLGKRARRSLNRGKPQLGNEAEAKAYLAAAQGLGTYSKRVAAQLPLVCGLRSGEVRHLQVRDIDFENGVIHIRSTQLDEAPGVTGWSPKTAAGRRVVGLPAGVRADIQSLCHGRPGTELLFPSARSGGGPYERKWLNRLVKRVCRKAGVRVICAHGLRGTYATILQTKGRLRAPDVSKLLGHGDGGRTARDHYIGAPDRELALEL